MTSIQDFLLLKIFSNTSNRFKTAVPTGSMIRLSSYGAGCDTLATKKRAKVLPGAPDSRQDVGRRLMRSAIFRDHYCSLTIRTENDLVVLPTASITIGARAEGISYSTPKL